MSEKNCTACDHPRHADEPCRIRLAGFGNVYCSCPGPAAVASQGGRWQHQAIGLTAEEAARQQAHRITPAVPSDAPLPVIRGWEPGFVVRGSDNPFDMAANNVSMVLTYKCGPCSGTGQVTDSLWAEYMIAESEFLATVRPSLRMESEMTFMEQWWANRGYDITGPREIGVAALPPDVSACGECDGTGEQLTEAGRTLLAFLDKLRPAR